MAHYYGVTRSEEYIAHYGIKGMRWGVRKAIEKGNDKKLSRLYRKSQKKLYKLNTKADIDMQKELAKRHTKRAIASAGIGALGLAAYGGITSGARKALSEARTGIDSIRKRKKVVVGSGNGVHKVGEGLNSNPAVDHGFVYPQGEWTDINGHTHYGAPKKVKNPVGGMGVGTYHSGAHYNVNTGESEVNLYHPSFVQTHNANSEAEALAKRHDKRIYKNIALGVGIAGMGTAAYQTGRAIASKYRTTKRGHAKAVAKRDKFKKEMNNAFKGTRFDNSRHTGKRW